MPSSNLSCLTEERIDISRSPNTYAADIFAFTDEAPQVDVFTFTDQVPDCSPRKLKDSIHPQVGDKVSVYWKNDSMWYKGTVQKLCKNGKFRIIYDDGDIEVLDLAKEKLRLLKKPSIDKLRKQGSGSEKTNANGGKCGSSKSTTARLGNRAKTTSSACAQKRKRSASKSSILHRTIKLKTSQSR